MLQLKFIIFYACFPSLFNEGLTTT